MNSEMDDLKRYARPSIQICVFILALHIEAHNIKIYDAISLLTIFVSVYRQFASINRNIYI